MAQKESHWNNITCPYFKSSDFKTRSISCEGPLEGSFIKQTFRSGSDLAGWEKKYCKGIFLNRLCPIYALLNWKYEQEGR
jgi:hypothetical protein